MPDFIKEIDRVQHPAAAVRRRRCDNAFSIRHIGGLRVHTVLWLVGWSSRIVSRFGLSCGLVRAFPGFYCIYLSIYLSICIYSALRRDNFSSCLYLSCHESACGMMGPIAALGLTSRSFLFVPYGEAVSPSLAASGPTISCDGRVPGSTLELTHWTDNVTPRPLPHVQSGLLAAPALSSCASSGCA